MHESKASALSTQNRYLIVRARVVKDVPRFQSHFWTKLQSRDERMPIIGHLCYILYTFLRTMITPYSRRNSLMLQYTVIITLHGLILNP